MHSATSVSRLLALLVAAALVPAALAQEKTEGKVVGTKLTHCDMNVKIGGCAGTLTMERKAAGKTEELTIKVPLGTPITRGSETVYLPALRGQFVAVSYIVDKSEKLAKSVEVLELKR